ncbi:MAG TPA: type II toxin-antitoxin system RelE/ParE family toxin, partial [Candidatus Saccharimonadia bacterium]|nr:type II toxin-antitoxin system RelE/ParE family toxin [Candidatus Saccharimonadia bacterium]
RVRFTPTGRAQFLAALAYIRRENPRAAVRFRQRAEQALRRLEQFPESGSRLSIRNGQPGVGDFATRVALEVQASLPNESTTKKLRRGQKSEAPTATGHPEW